jgi:hypothetical protein
VNTCKDNRIVIFYGRGAAPGTLLFSRLAGRSGAAVTGTTTFTVTESKFNA